MTAHLIALVLAAAPATPPRLAVVPLQAGEGVSEQMTGSVSDVLASELRRLDVATIITPKELGAVLSMERQKALMGCASESCLAELAGALDAEQVVTGSLARLGESWFIQVMRVDARKGLTVGHASRRKKGATIDDVLDELPAMAKELCAGMPAKAGGAALRAASHVAEVPGAASVPSLPPPYQDVALQKVPDLESFVVVVDDEGHHLAIQPFQGLDGLLLAGDGKALYAQRLGSGGSEGRIRFNVSFWDPRAKNPSQAMFEFRDGKYQLTCGTKTIPYKPLGAARAAKLLRSAKLYDVRWQRHAYALARDEEGNWFYVDQARSPEDDTDFRLYLGTAGEMTAHEVDVLAHDRAGDVFRGAGGKLKLDHAKKEAEWIVGDRRTKLVFLDLYAHASFIYGQLGAYKDMPLGTPCDPHF